MKSKILLLVLVVVFLCSCNSNQSNKLRIGYVPIAVGLPLFVAVEEGYFEEEGFEVEMIRFTSSNEVGNAGTSNQVDILLTASNVILDIGHVSGKKHKLIITNNYPDSPGHIADYLLVRDTTEISNIQDLKGKKIGIFPGSVIKVFCNLILQNNGLEPDDYELIELSTKDWAVALKSGQIDALSALEPSGSQIVLDGLGYKIVDGFYAKLMPNVPLSGHWISSDYYQKYGKEKTDKIIRAYDKAVKLISTNPSKAKSHLLNYANIREDVLNKVELNPWVSHEQVNYIEIQSFIDTLYKYKAIQNREHIEDYKIK